MVDMKYYEKNRAWNQILRNISKSCLGLDSKKKFQMIKIIVLGIRKNRAPLQVTWDH